MAVPEKYKHIDFKPPKGVADNAKKGLELRKKQKGDKAGLTPSEASKEGIGSGVQRAVNLSNRDPVSPEVIGQMVGFFSRHDDNVDLDAGKEPEEDNGYISGLLWGGRSGESWAKKIQKQMEKADEKEKTAFRVASRWLLRR